MALIRFVLHIMYYIYGDRRVIFMKYISTTLRLYQIRQLMMNLLSLHTCLHTFNRGDTENSVPRFVYVMASKYHSVLILYGFNFSRYPFIVIDIATQ